MKTFIVLVVCLVNAFTFSSGQQNRITRDPQCGKEKGCFDDCTEGSCNWSITWQTRGNNLAFNFKRLTNGNSYIAVGFSGDTIMGTDSVLECATFGNQIQVSHSANSDYKINFNVARPREGIFNESNLLKDGILECDFERVTAGTSDPNVFDLETNYYLLVAQGDVTNAEFQKQKHSTTPPSSPNVVDLQKHEAITIGTPDIVTTTQGPTGANPIMRDDECDSTKGCFDDCSDDGKQCSFTVTWSHEGTNIRFRFKSYSATNSYMALGLSSDTQMGNDNVFVCAEYNGQVVVYESFNPGRYNVRLDKPDEGLSDTKGYFKDGILECSFVRTVRATSDPLSANLNTDGFLFLARGATSGDFSIMIHSSIPHISENIIDFQQIGEPVVIVSSDATVVRPMMAIIISFVLILIR